jgi:hypothetical protein
LAENREKVSLNTINMIIRITLESFREIFLSL